MINNNHPITPPPELVQQLADGPGTWLEKIINAYCVGADQQLEQCVDWVNEYESSWLNGYEREGPAAEQMRNACRPKPPSLKEQALETLRSMQIDPVVINGVNLNADVMAKYDIIRRALEALPD